MITKFQTLKDLKNKKSKLVEVKYNRFNNQI